MSETQATQPEDTGASQDEGLLGGLDVKDANAKEVNPEAAAVDHRAAESIPEDEAVDRPEWWPENFWKENEPDLEGIAKSWKDMRKMVSQGKHKAPADGKYDLKVFGENPDALPMVPVFTKWAADNGVSQAAFDQFAGDVVKMAGELSTGPTIDPAVEKKALGPNADAVINGMVSWARGLVNKGVWNGDDFEEFKVMGGTAKGLKALMKVRESYEGRIPIESQPIEGQPTDVELQQMVGDPKYQSDPAYRQKVERLFAQRYN
jgi:hypothetical protein